MVPFIAASTALLLAFAHPESSERDHSAASDRKAARQAAARWREAISTLEVSYDRIPTNASKMTKTHYQLAMAPGGKYSLKAVATLLDGRKKVITNERTDGKRIYREMAMTEDVNTSNFVSIVSNDDPPDHYSGPKCEFLWLTLPAGRPLHRLLDEYEGDFELKKDGGSDFLHVFTFKPPSGAIVRCELSAKHDWLPATVQINDDPETEKYKAHVTKFKRVDGIEFPWEGEISVKTPAGAWAEHRFVVKELLVNRPIPDAVFQPRGIVPGTLIMDHIKDTAWVEGGDEARKKLMELEPRPKKDASNSGHSKPIVAESEEMSWSRWIMGGSIALLLAAGLYGVRQSRVSR